MSKLKRYDKFVKENYETVDEFDIDMSNPSQQPTPSRPAPDTPTKPDVPVRPRPTRPGITPTEIPSEQDNPLAYNREEEEEEEEGGDLYVKSLRELANELGVSVRNNAIHYNGKRIIYPSETEMFHVGKRKFKTVEEVLDYLSTNESRKNRRKK